MAASLAAPLSTHIARLRDVVDLTKPRITTMVVFTTGIGMAVAPGTIGTARAVAVLLLVALLVASANTLNCFLERESDARMHRTQRRPLPAGRLDPWAAAALGIGMASFAVPGLGLVANPSTAVLGLVAWLTYVAVYTPLKRISPLALEIGAVPGALPPLMGWTAVTGRPGLGGWALFAVMFVWQLPHFLAIASLYREDYERGGLQVLPVAMGEAVSRARLVLTAALLLPASLLLLPLAGPVYGITAVLLGSVFLLLAVRARRHTSSVAPMRAVFGWSLLYLTVLFSVLVTTAR